MRRIYKIGLAALCFALCSAQLAEGQQTSHYQEVFTQARPGARVAVDGSAYHQISWTTSGSPGSCLLALDYSNDGVVWQLGGTIPMRDCTQSGSSTVVGQNIKYVRLNLNSLSPTAAISAVYTGYQTNPGPTGSVTSVFGRTGDVIAAVGDYNVAQITGAASLDSPAFTGAATAATPPTGDNSNRIATTAYVNAIFQSCCNGGAGAVASVFGRTGAVTAAAGDYSVAQVTGAAPLASPIFTGNPQGPTPVTTDNSTSLATTAWVKAQGYGTGTGSVASVFGRTGAVAAAIGDYTVAQVTGAAPLASPTFTGTPAGPTATAGTNTTQLATTAFVMANQGPVSSVFGRTGAVIAVNNDYSVGQVAGAAPLASPTFTGAVHAPTAVTTDNSTLVATTAWVKAQGYGTGGTGAVNSVFGRQGTVVATTGDYGVAQVTGAAPLASPTFTGSAHSVTPALTDNSTLIATTAWVKNQGYGTGNGAVSSVFGRTGAIAATTGDYGVAQVTGAAALASPTFTGTPLAPTATAGTNTTQIATTAFVLANRGVVSVFGRTATNIVAAAGDYTVAQVTNAAPLASPTFTGTPAGPTPPTNDNSTRLATTAFVLEHVGAAGGGDATGLNFNGTIIPLGSPAPTTGQFLTYNGTNIVGAPGGAGVLGGVIIIQ